MVANPPERARHSRYPERLLDPHFVAFPVSGARVLQTGSSQRTTSRRFLKRAQKLTRLAAAGGLDLITSRSASTYMVSLSRPARASRKTHYSQR